MYHDDDSVPDEAVAMLVGEAKGRISNSGMSVLPSVVIKAKRTVLKLDVDPWIAELALKRLHRRGQTHEVYVYRLTCADETT